MSNEDSVQYTLTGGAISSESGSSFTVTLTSADQLALDGVFNKAGTASTDTDIFNQGAGPTTYVISAGNSFDVGGRFSNGGVTVSNALAPTITSVAYNTSTGVLTLNGTGFENSGTFGGIGLGQITINHGQGWRQSGVHLQFERLRVRDQQHGRHD